MQALSDLYTEEHTYRTVVVDSLDWLERLIWEEVCKQKTVENIEDIGYAKGYMFALTQWREFLDRPGSPARRPGHDGHPRSRTRRSRSSRTPRRRTTTATCRASTSSPPHIVQEWCDEVLFATYRVHVKQTKEGFDKKVTKGVGTGERIIRTTERPAHVAKNRLNLPEELPLDWNAYAQFLAEAPAASEVASGLPVPFHSQGETRVRPERVQCE